MAIGSWFLRGAGPFRRENRHVERREKRCLRGEKKKKASQGLERTVKGLSCSAKRKHSSSKSRSGKGRQNCFSGNLGSDLLSSSPGIQNWGRSSSGTVSLGECFGRLGLLTGGLEERKASLRRKGLAPPKVLILGVSSRRLRKKKTAARNLSPKLQENSLLAEGKGFPPLRKPRPS